MSFLAQVLLAQLVAISVVVFVLKKVLDNILIETALKQLEWSRRGEQGPLTDAVTLTTHKNLRASSRARIVQYLKKHLKITADPVFQVDPKIWGGMIIQCGFRHIDFSLRDRLRQARSW
ncbi:MAG: F0F1 ATP synthase subunit delta [Candidatus Omnitrophota bacterium]|nr:F0F1 ATP synthase subunit delta [Candidatus Omnitrophota bacterium]MDZ4242724.1 F0F1 ATP synthase subunit delta [Candidatus Omnitrophota bacterium]